MFRRGESSFSIRRNTTLILRYFLLLSECQDRKHWISSNLSSLNPRTCHRKISRSILVRSTRIISSSIPEGTNTFFRPTTFTYDILFRMNNALKYHQSGCVSLNLSPLLSREYSYDSQRAKGKLGGIPPTHNGFLRGVITAKTPYGTTQTLFVPNNRMQKQQNSSDFWRT